jgi:hypothetical protein
MKYAVARQQHKRNQFLHFKPQLDWTQSRCGCCENERNVQLCQESNPDTLLVTLSYFMSCHTHYNKGINIATAFMILSYLN